MYCIMTLSVIAHVSINLKGREECNKTHPEKAEPFSIFCFLVFCFFAFSNKKEQKKKKKKVETLSVLSKCHLRNPFVALLNGWCTCPVVGRFRVPTSWWSVH